MVLAVLNRVRKVGVLCSSASYIVSDVDTGMWQFHELPKVLKGEKKF